MRRAVLVVALQQLRHAHPPVLVLWLRFPNSATVAFANAARNIGRDGAAGFTRGEADILRHRDASASDMPPGALDPLLPREEKARIMRRWKRQQLQAEQAQQRQSLNVPVNFPLRPRSAKRVASHSASFYNGVQRGEDRHGGHSDNFGGAYERTYSTSRNSDARDRGAARRYRDMATELTAAAAAAAANLQRASGQLPMGDSDDELFNDDIEEYLAAQPMRSPRELLQGRAYRPRDDSRRAHAEHGRRGSHGGSSSTSKAPLRPALVSLGCAAEDAPKGVAPAGVGIDDEDDEY